MQARLRPDKAAIVDLASGRSWTYAQLDEYVARCALQSAEAAWHRPRVLRSVALAGLGHTVGLLDGDSEFRRALGGLIDQGMERLILDLRGNVGGLLTIGTVDGLAGVTQVGIAVHRGTAAVDAAASRLEGLELLFGSGQGVVQDHGALLRGFTHDDFPC